MPNNYLKNDTFCGFGTLTLIFFDQLKAIAVCFINILCSLFYRLHYNTDEINSFQGPGGLMS